MRVLTDEPFVPDPGSIFHMQEIIVMMIIVMIMMVLLMAMCHVQGVFFGWPP